MVHRITRTALGAVLVAGLLTAPAAEAKPGGLLTRPGQAAGRRARARSRRRKRPGRQRGRRRRASSPPSGATSPRRRRRRCASSRRRPPAPSPARRGTSVSGTVAMFDGLSGDPVAGTATTLKAALDGRDALVAAINALSDKSAYERVLSLVNARRDRRGRPTSPTRWPTTSSPPRRRPRWRPPRRRSPRPRRRRRLPRRTTRPTRPTAPPLGGGRRGLPRG